MSVARLAEWEDEGDVVWWFILRLLTLIVWLECSTFHSEAPLLQSGFDRLPRISDLIASCYPFLRAYVWLYRPGVIFFSLASCDFARFLVICSPALFDFCEPCRFSLRRSHSEGEVSTVTGVMRAPTIQGSIAVSMAWSQGGGFRWQFALRVAVLVIRSLTLCN